MIELNRLKKKTLYKQVADELKEYIIKNNLKSGDRLPTEHELAEILGVSRTSVREGIRFLETLGFIETRIKTGITVKKENLQPITEYLLFNLKHSKVSWKELVEARKILEIDAVELAVKNIDEEQIKQIEYSNLMAEKKIQACESIDEEDYMFHYLLFKATKNKIIEQFNAILKEFFYNDQLKSQIRINIDTDISNQVTLNSHRMILDAIKNKDVESAKIEIINHLRNYEEMDLIV